VPINLYTVASCILSPRRKTPIRERGIHPSRGPGILTNTTHRGRKTKSDQTKRKKKQPKLKTNSIPKTGTKFVEEEEEEEGSSPSRRRGD
jgi:hypothetical protein